MAVPVGFELVQRPITVPVGFELVQQEGIDDVAAPGVHGVTPDAQVPSGGDAQGLGVPADSGGGVHDVLLCQSRVHC